MNIHNTSILHIGLGVFTMNALINLELVANEIDNSCDTNDNDLPANQTCLNIRKPVGELRE